MAHAACANREPRGKPWKTWVSFREKSWKTHGFFRKNHGKPMVLSGKMKIKIFSGTMMDNLWFFPCFFPTFPKKWMENPWSLYVFPLRDQNFHEPLGDFLFPSMENCSINAGIGWGLIGPGAQQEDVALRALVGEFSPFYLYQW